jgi:molybdopterin-guanine dinucleotide biosynthesis protein A
MMALQAALIAGGASRRMGCDKALLRLDGATLLERTATMASRAGLAVRIVGRCLPDDWQGPPCLAIPDRQRGCGPLGGICAALAASAPDAVLCLPCDLPGLTVAALRWLIARWQGHGGAHGSVALHAGRPDPLFAIYTPAALASLDAALARGELACWRCIAAGEYDRCPVPAAHAAALTDCDTPAVWRAMALERG